VERQTGSLKAHQSNQLKTSTSSSSEPAPGSCWWKRGTSEVKSTAVTCLDSFVRDSLLDHRSAMALSWKDLQHAFELQCCFF